MPIRKSQRAKERLIDARDEKLARIILAAIRYELGDADFFTREDLLQLTPLQGVATITRYNEVCTAVHRLVGSRQMIALSRTELCLPDREKRYIEGDVLHRIYEHTIRRLLKEQVDDRPKAPIDVMALVVRWKMDQHVSLNCKRVAVRNGLRQLARDGLLRLQENSLAYEPTKELANG